MINRFPPFPALLSTGVECKDGAICGLWLYITAIQVMITTYPIARYYL